MKWLRKTLFVISPFQLVVTHMVLQVLDWATTLFVVLNTHTGVESNPIVRFMLNDPNGVWWFTAAKLALCIMLAWLIPRSLRNTPGYGWVWRSLAIIYFAVVLSNFVGVAIVCMLL
ncbi:MAG: DUF5658 family protein [Candidatus Thorarchaeota archaeon]|jgi:hypothetical protein